MFKAVLFGIILAVSSAQGCNVDKKVVQIVIDTGGVNIWPDGSTSPQYGLCTGSIISADGMVITARHCIDKRANNDSVFVLIGNAKVPAKIIASAIRGYDFAILDIPGNNHSFLPLCGSVSKGDQIAVLGMPGGPLEYSMGVVVKNEDGDLITTAETRPGFSGGPVVNPRLKCLAGVHWGRVNMAGKWFSAETSIDKIKTIIDSLK